MRVIAGESEFGGEGAAPGRRKLNGDIRFATGGNGNRERRCWIQGEVVAAVGKGDGCDVQTARYPR